MKIHAETHHFWCFLRDSRREDFVFGNLPGHLFQIAWRSYDIHHWADFLWLPQCQKSALLPQKHLGHTAPKNEVASYYMLSGWIIILHKPGNYRFWGRVSHEKKHPFRSSVAFDNGGHNSSKCFYCHSSQFQIIHPDVTGHHHNSSLMTSGWCKSNLFIRTYGLDRFMISSSIHPSIHPSIHSSIHLFVRSLVHWFIEFLTFHWFTGSLTLIQWFTDSSVLWLVHWFTESFLGFIDSSVH